MILEFEDELGLLDEQTRAVMQRCAQSAQAAEGVSEKLAVFVRIVNDDEIQEINDLDNKSSRKREQREKGKKIKMTRKDCQIKIPVSRFHGIINARKMAES